MLRSALREICARTLTLVLVFGFLGPGQFLATSAVAATEASFRPYAADSIWNQRLRDDAPLSPDSSRYVAFFNRQVDRFGGYVNSNSCGTPTFWAAPRTPRIAVRLDHPSYMDPALIAAWSSVPMPETARPAACSDRNFAVLQRQPDGTVNQWEFYGATKTPNGSWSARWGGSHRGRRA